MNYRFIAFNMISQNSLGWAETARQALENAASLLDGDSSFIEVLDCGTAGEKIVNASLPLYRAREANKTVFRGDGYAPNDPAIPLTI
jgi:hypothetical protein